MLGVYKFYRSCICHAVRSCCTKQFEYISAYFRKLLKGNFKLFHAFCTLCTVYISLGHIQKSKEGIQKMFRLYGNCWNYILKCVMHFTCYLMKHILAMVNFGFNNMNVLETILHSIHNAWKNVIYKNFIREDVSCVYKNGMRMRRFREL